MEGTLIMCCIFGIGLFRNHCLKNVELFRKIVTSMVACNVIGGRTAAGLSINSEEKMVIFKQPRASTDLIKMTEYDKFIKDNINVNKTISVIGHCRQKTKGTEQNNVNNHPIVRDNVVGVHNGHISNDDSLFSIWQKSFARNGEVDSEIIFALIDHLSGGGGSIASAIQKTSRLLNGSFACSLTHRRSPNFVWIFRRTNPVTIQFFEEYNILMWSTEKNNIHNALYDVSIGPQEEIKVPENSGIGFDLFNRQMHDFQINTYKPND